MATVKISRAGELKTMMHSVVQPRTVDDLIGWFEENFSCLVGWPMARTGEGAPPSLEETNARHSSEWPGTVRYEVYGFSADDTELDHLRLVIAIYIAFSRKLRELPELGGTRLYWRYPQKIHLDHHGGESMISVRIAIPALAGRTDGLPLQTEGYALRSLYIEA